MSQTMRRSLSDCTTLSVGRDSRPSSASGKLRLGAIQLQGSASVLEAGEARRKQRGRAKTLEELRAALVCMDASMGAILSRLTSSGATAGAGTGAERLERSMLSDQARNHLTRWVRGDISGRYCFLLMEEEWRRNGDFAGAFGGMLRGMDSSGTSSCKGSGWKGCGGLGPDAVMEMLGAMVGLTEEDGFYWEGSWLYENVFSKAPATMLKEAVEALVAVAQTPDTEAQLADHLAKLRQTRRGGKPRNQLLAEEINLAFRRLAMRAAPISTKGGKESDSQSNQDGKNQNQESGKEHEQEDIDSGAPKVGPGHEFLRTQIWKELFHIHANGEDEKDACAPEPRAEFGETGGSSKPEPAVLERDDQWLQHMLLRPTDQVQRESESVETAELKKSNEQLNAYIQSALKLKKKLALQVKSLEQMSAYAMLGIDRNATTIEIKKAYREMAIKLHPDKGGDADRFRELQLAYESILAERKKEPHGGRASGSGGASTSTSTSTSTTSKDKKASSKDKKPKEKRSSPSDDGTQGSNSEDEEEEAEQDQEEDGSEAEDREEEGEVDGGDAASGTKDKDLPQNEEADIDETFCKDTNEQSSGDMEAKDNSKIDGESEMEEDENVDEDRIADENRAMGAEGDDVEESESRADDRVQDEECDESSKPEKNIQHEQDENVDPKKENEGKRGAKGGNGSSNGLGERMRTAMEILSDEGGGADDDDDQDDEEHLSQATEQVAFLAARSREDADKAGSSAQRMLHAIKLLDMAGADTLTSMERTSKSCLELSRQGSEESESAGTHALAVAQRALGLRGQAQDLLQATQAGALLATAATKSADAGVFAVEKALGALRTYNEMMTTLKTAEARMCNWRARGVVDQEMETICCDLHRATLKTINQAVKDCAKAAIDAAVAACYVSRLLHTAVGQMQGKREEEELRREAEEEQQKKADEEAEAKRQAGEEGAEDKEEEEKKSKEEKEKEEKEKEEDEEMMNDPKQLEKKLQVLLRVKNTLLIKEVNGSILKLQYEMQHLLQTRLFSLETHLVSPAQKQNVFSSVAELFDQGCSSLEAALPLSYPSFYPLSPSTEELEWWESSLESSLGWVWAAVEHRELAMPSARAQIVRLAAFVDSGALTFMAVEELFANILRIVSTAVRAARAASCSDDINAEQEEIDIVHTRINDRCSRVVKGIQSLVLCPGTVNE